MIFVVLLSLVVSSSLILGPLLPGCRILAYCVCFVMLDLLLYNNLYLWHYK